MPTEWNPTRKLALWAVLLAASCAGCNTVATKAIPASRLPPWLLAEPRANREPINLIRLRQDPPAVYQLGPRDILGVYIEGVLPPTRPDAVPEPPPVHFPEDGNSPPALGYPVPIREDGTLALPLIAPISVSGLTLTQAEDQVRRAYIEAGVLTPGFRLIFTLIRKRTYQVLVIREDIGSAFGTSGGLLVGPSKRGSASAVDLPAYENDVLHALTETGGLPGLDAQNEVIILRGAFADAQARDGLLRDMQATPYYGPDGVAQNNPNVIRIPLRARPGAPPLRLRQEDIILTTGDVVFIETREREVFYTGGLLQGAEHLLPRDYDLDVVAAVSVAGGSIATASGSGNRNAPFGGGGGGFGSIIPPTQVIVVRQLPGGGTVPISVDLNRALISPGERILIQPGDLVSLEYKPWELVANLILNQISFQYFINNFNN